jgi:N-acetylglucosamine kinase-like BadF-type ATPase
VVGVTPAVPDGVLAIDAGNSKTDVALVGSDGTILGTARGGGFAPQIVGAEQAVAGLAPLVAEATAALDPASRVVAHVSACLANADLPVEVDQLASALRARGWGSTVTVANDTFALLRAGTDEPRGVAVVCGAGINCSGIGNDGRTVRFAAVGRISGDWGGGSGLAEEALWSAARAEDGRGPATALATALPARFGLPTMAALIEALHLEVISYAQRFDLVPVLFEVAAAGDEAARGLVHRQADEVVAMAIAALRRLELLDEPTDLILGGGVLTAGHPLLMDRIDELLAAGAPKAVQRVVSTPPVAGAALLGLDRIGASAGAHARLRAAFG